MSNYTTGELARACGVSVRTVQFYDTKNLLKPAALTEGGRRLYTDDDLKRLRLICLLKSLGLSLDAIRGILASETPNTVLLLLLDEQEKQLRAELGEKQKQIAALQVVRGCLRDAGAVPVNTIHDIEEMMKRKKLWGVYRRMLTVGLMMGAVQWGTLLLWILRGIWWPFAAGMAAVAVAGVLLTRMYHRNTAYICPRCGETFQPSMWGLVFSLHTPKARRLRCVKCGETGYCVEVYAENGGK